MTKTSNTFINRITILFYVLGLGLLFIAAKMWLGTPADDVQLTTTGIEKTEPYLAMQEQFDVDDLVSTQEFSFLDAPVELQNDGVIALYILTTDACAPCLTEMFLYGKLLDQYGVAGKSVQHLAIIFGDDKRRAQRFVMTTDLSRPAAYYHGEKYADFLLLFQNWKTQGQLILVDQESKRAFFRAALSTTYGAPNEERLNIMYAAESAFKQL